jgi:hypothetical protein
MASSKNGGLVAPPIPPPSLQPATKRFKRDPGDEPECNQQLVITPGADLTLLPFGQNVSGHVCVLELGTNIFMTIMDRFL